MKKILLSAIFILTMIINVNAQLPNTWIKKADFANSNANDIAVAFSIGNYGYIGLGYNSTNGTNTKAFWKYDPLNDTWTQIADFGGSGRSGAVAFSLSNKAYVGTGVAIGSPGGGATSLKDFWEYDPVTNIWTQKANFGGLARRFGLGISIGNKGYIGLGVSGPNGSARLKDFWEYDPLTNIWTQKVDYPDSLTFIPTGFCIGNKGYVGLGSDWGSGVTAKFFEYDPSINQWTQKASFSYGWRRWATGFSIGNKGYLGTGESGSVKRDFWEYDPIQNGWTQKADFGGHARDNAVAFTIGNCGYIATGDSFTTHFKDMWQYTPSLSLTASFTATPLNILTGQSVQFTNQSQLATSYSWAFAGGTPSTYNGQTPPPIQYNTIGTYDVTLSATDGVTTDVHTESSYIHVTANNVTGLSRDPDIDFGNVVAPGYADHVYFFYNNSPDPITISTIQFPVNSGFGVQFVNGATVLPYQNLPVLLQFFPQLQQTYSATATVISNAPNNPITFHVTGIGTAQSISWIGVYNKPENNPEITQLEPLAENYITSNTQSTVKICADFSKATVVKFINNSGTIASSNIRFRMKSDPNGNNTDYTGWFITTDYSVVGNLVTARFTHPKYLNGNALYRVDTIQVVNSANNAVIYEHPARIYRAPVVLVHGLWGNAYSMQDIQYQLITSGKYNSTMVKVIDYESTNSYDYNTNSNVVKDGINNTLIGLRILKYSAGKVDIVAHSMGGILSRIYLQNPDCMGTPNNCYRSDIHKLITLNTPHSGTQVANFFLGNSNCAAIARLLLGQNGMNWSNGAVADLQCNSPAIAAMNSTPSLNRHIVPCRATATYTTLGPTTVLTNENALTNAIGVCRAESGLQFNNTVFLFTPNDLIVPDNSQIGGLSDYSYIANTMHTESPNSSSVISDLQVSLEENAATSSLFDGNIGGFNPPYISPTLKTNETDQDTHDGPRSGNITITNPSFGFSTTSGSTIQVSVTTASTINRIITTVGNIQTGIYSIDTTTNNFSFNYTVPTTVVGKISIVALGFDNIGLVDFDTIEIQSVPSIAPDSVKFVEEFIAVPKSRTTGFRLMGYFNGIQNDITELSGSTFSIDSTPIATITNVSNIYGADTGLTTLQGTYQGKSAYAYVKVYIGSDWVISSLNSPTDTNKSSNNFSIFPNPTTGIVNILCNKNNFKGSYSIFDVTGRKILSGNVSEKLFTIDLEKFSSGLYYLHVTDTEGENQFQGKIIKG